MQKVGVLSSIFGILVVILGILYLMVVHFVPAFICFLLALVYFPPADALFQKRLGMRVPIVLKILIGLFIIWFTLGISDLGDMIDG